MFNFRLVFGEVRLLVYKGHNVLMLPKLLDTTHGERVVYPDESFCCVQRFTACNYCQILYSHTGAKIHFIETQNSLWGAKTELLMECT